MWTESNHIGSSESFADIIKQMNEKNIISGENEAIENYEKELLSI